MSGISEQVPRPSNASGVSADSVVPPVVVAALVLSTTDDAASVEAVLPAPPAGPDVAAVERGAESAEPAAVDCDGDGDEDEDDLDVPVQAAPARPSTVPPPMRRKARRSERTTRVFFMNELVMAAIQHATASIAP